MSATLLADGRVLILSDDTAELYVPAVRTSAPQIYSQSGDGRGQGAILHGGTGRVASPDDPVSAGEIVEIYCTGLIDGSVIPPRVTIGGRPAQVLYFGKAPGYESLNQINVRVPGGIPPSGEVSVRIHELDRPSNEVKIGVK